MMSSLAPNAIGVANPPCQRNPRDLSSYDYALDSRLIAQKPTLPKSAAKLLVYDRASDKITHTTFARLWDFIPPKCLIVLNDTQVIRARIYGAKPSGAKIELLYHSKCNESGRFLVQIRGKVRVGDWVIFGGGVVAKVVELCEDGLRIVEFYESLGANLSDFGDLDSGKLDSQYLDSFNFDSRHFKMLDFPALMAFLEIHGHIPLPPYIKRADSESDSQDYQSVFAKNIGSIAAPTASLHFSQNDMKAIAKRPHCFISLHIGAGTFFGVETHDITAHKMHKESFFVSRDSANAIMNASEILCVGTTATRCVEYLAQNLAQNVQNQTKSDSQIPRLWMNFRGCAKRTTQIEHKVHQGSELKHSTKSRHKLNLGDFGGECDIFINPLNPPIKTSHILTNFHLPKSTLIMLVAGFIGIEKTLEIYQIAQDLEYKFYSYGDGMLIL